MTEPLPTLLRRISAVQRAGSAVAACIVVAARGSTPQPAGALMFLDDAGRLFGTIGGGCLEAEVRRRAMALLTERRSALLRFRLDHDYGWDDGLICGGTVELAVGPAPDAQELEDVASAIEQGQPARIVFQIASDTARERITLSIPPRARLCIAGAGHIGCAVARHAIALEFDVTIFDDRPDLLARSPESARTICGPIAKCLGEASLDGNTYCLIVTRGHRHDQQALAAILQRNATQGVIPRYIGMIGSRRKIKVIFDDLESRGVPRDQLASVHAPVGIDIGAHTVEEIAVSIAAQLVQVRADGASTFPVVERRSFASFCAEPGRRPPVGVLLAAGRGRRMGCTKQLLPCPGDAQNRTMVAAAYDAVAAACSQMIVVVGHDAEAVLAALSGRTFTPIVAPAGAEMSESLRCGLHAAAGLDPEGSVLLHLADHPRVGQQTLEAVLEAGRQNPDLAILPTHAGRGGHPILIAAALVQRLRQQPLEGGLRTWWESNPGMFIHLPLDDPSILLDLDTPEEYSRASQQPRSAPSGAEDESRREVSASRS